MQPSQYDIQREVEALRDIRRRSTTPGALTIDPDLPNQTSPNSSGYWTGASPTDDSSSSSHEEGSGSTENTSEDTHNFADDPFHLFWVPASVHPEIAPAEFRAFLKEHSRSPPPGDGPAPLSRAGSFSSVASSGLGRKKSMLSRQYRPSENDGVGETEEKIVPLRRNRSSIYSNQGPQLTINDLQKLEELAEEASESDDPSKLRTLLRRSLSLNISPTAIETMDNMPDMGDEADIPILVPPPGKHLRRRVRTQKNRKSSLPGDGGGHGFGASRRGASARAAKVPAERSSTDLSSSDHGDHVDADFKRPRALSNELQSQRPESFSEEGFIYDAYAHDEEEEHPSAVVVTSSPPPPELPVEAPQTPPQAQITLPEPTVQPSLIDALDPVLHHPQPQRLLSPQPPADQQQPSRTPSPISPSPSDVPTPAPAPVVAPPAFLSSPPQPHTHRKEKDKKGLFGKWGSDKGGKKQAKEHQRVESHDRAEKEKEKEKDSGFFGSLFGGKKSKDSDNAPPPIAVHGGSAGREAAQALLGASKSSKNYQPPPSPGAQLINNYSRYPIHVERAIYRLSHIKLANPRRPLYEQVLISNLMFWYLGVINKAQTPASPPNGQANGMSQAEKEQKEREQKEAEQREKEKQEKERQEREQREREREEMKKREASPRRGPLTKPAAVGAGGRRAEMPVKGPQYEMQHREMEQAYGGYAGGYGGHSPSPQQQGMGMPMGRGPSPGPGQRMQQPPPGAPRLVQASSEPQAPDHFYYASPEAMQMQQQQQRLPPGAMPPVDQSAWGASSASRQHSASPPPGARRSRSPPSGNYNQQSMGQQMYGQNAQQDQYAMGGGGRSPGRSLSATAVPSSPPTVNGKLRKGTSAHAVVQTHGRPRTAEGQPPYQANGVAEEEDVPLAVWQQQRRK